MNLKRYFCLIVLSILYLGCLYGQNEKISARIVDGRDGSPINGVIVQLLNNRADVIKYTITSSDGRFDLDYSGDITGLLLRLSCLGYRCDTIKLNELTDIYKLVSQPITLKEVEIRAPKIVWSGDTISYNVESFAGAADRTIGDVLSKMPGIEVSKTGEISYNGTPINKFYIEGSDLLDGRYGIAANNISKSDVATVEVLENHQPIKVLKGVSYSDKAAINIRLKPDAKMKWSGSIKGGLGIPVGLFNVESAVMSFGGKTQSINTFKGNNAGDDVTVQTQEMFLGKNGLSLIDNYGEIKNYIDVLPSTASNIDPKAVRFGHNEAFTSNTLFKLGKEVDLKAGLVLTNSRFNFNRKTSTTYFLSDSLLTVLEDENSVVKTKGGALDISIIKNNDNFYLKNLISADLVWNNILLSTDGSYPNIQKAYINSQRYSNDFNLIKRLGRQTISFNWFNQYYMKPQGIFVVEDIENLGQKINVSSFVSNMDLSYGFAVKRWNFFVNTGVLYYEQFVLSDMYLLFKVYLIPKAEYKSKYLNFSVEMPFKHCLYKNNGFIENKFIPSVKLNFKYQATAKFAITVRGMFNQSEPLQSIFYSDTIMNNYRTFSRGIADFNSTMNGYVNLGFVFKNPVSMFFANLSVSGSWIRRPVISIQDFYGEYIFNSYFGLQNDSRVWSVSTNVSKGFDLIKTTASVGMSFHNLSMLLIRNQVVIPFVSNSVLINPKIDMHFLKWFNFGYEMDFSFSRLNVNELISKTYYLNQSLNLVFIPVKKLNIKTSVNYFLNSVSKLFLCDVYFEYCLNSKIDLMLSVTNIFNKKQYGYYVYDGLNFVNCHYLIRPINIMVSCCFRF